MAVEVHGAEHAPVHAPPPPRRGLRRLTGPGWLRVLWTMPLAWALGTLLVLGARSAMGFEPLWELPLVRAYRRQIDSKIADIEINPLMVRENGAVAVDVRVLWRDAQGA